MIAEPDLNIDASDNEAAPPADAIDDAAAAEGVDDATPQEPVDENTPPESSTGSALSRRSVGRFHPPPSLPILHRQVDYLARDHSGRCCWIEIAAPCCPDSALGQV
jgi:hypothetical protein